MKEINDRPEIDQHLAALLSNSGAVQAVTEAVRGTFGPKGLDCLLVDGQGTQIVTNDGITVLKAMDVNHPAAKMIISAVEDQETQVGDGTTTAAIIAGSLVAEGANQVIRGVPVIKVIEGIKIGIQNALQLLKDAITIIPDINSPILERIAFIAGREHRELADLIIQAGRILGGERLREPGFKLADQIIAIEGRENELILGAIINKEPLNKEMPRRLEKAKLIILDDALEPRMLESETLTTEAGLNQKLQHEREFIENINKLARLGVNLIITDRGISDQAEELLTDLGIIGVQRVAAHEWRRLAEMTGARPIKRWSLFKTLDELEKLTGDAAEVIVDECSKQIRILKTPHQKFVTILVGAYTKEVVGERERIAKDAASAVQAAWRGGVVPGGGSVEFAIARILKRKQLVGMTSYGFECVIEALKQPITQICANAGYNPLEKLEEVSVSDNDNLSFSIGVNCDTGMIEDLSENGVWDPYDVKYFAIQSAGEVAEAILRINTVIKMKETLN